MALPENNLKTSKIRYRNISQNRLGSSTKKNFNQLSPLIIGPKTLVISPWINKNYIIVDFL